MSPTTAPQPFTPQFRLLVGLIVVAIAMRLLTHYSPASLPYHFSPVGAIALFAGAWFADRRYAFIVPIIAMLLSDLLIGLHVLLPVVYLCMALTAWIGFALRGRVSALRVGLGAVASAVVFFLVTNLAFWLTQGIYPALTYPMTAEGLLQCYAAAIPFLKNDLLGTLLWSGVLFGGFEVLRRRVAAPQDGVRA